MYGEELRQTANARLRESRVRSADPIFRLALVELFPDLDTENLALSSEGQIVGIQESCLILFEPYQPEGDVPKCRVSMVPMREVAITIDYRHRWTAPAGWSDGQVGSATLATPQGEYSVAIVDTAEEAGGAEMSWLSKVIQAKSSA